MAHFPFRGSLPFSGVKPGFSYGLRAPFRPPLPVKEVEERLYAFTVSDRAQPSVFDYDLGDEGLKALANLVRSEDVIAIIQGKQASFEAASVVELSVNGTKRADRMVLPRSY